MSYAMYTEQGDALVGVIVDRAVRNQWTWAMTLAALVQLSRNHPDVAAEATDTAVRECVYTAIGAHDRDEDFYV
jgi:hypothetical protein